MPRDVPIISSAEQDIMFTCGVWGTVPDLLTLHLLKYIVTWTKHFVFKALLDSICKQYQVLLYIPWHTHACT